jgi:hypothetical protein
MTEFTAAAVSMAEEQPFMVEALAAVASAAAHSAVASAAGLSVSRVWAASVPAASGWPADR